MGRSIFPPDDSLRLLSPQGPPQRVDHVLPPNVGCGASPSGPADCDSLDARTYRQTRRHAKNDCERNAAKRFIAKLRQDHPHLKFIVTEDSLSSNAPHIETLHVHGLHYILGVKDGAHAYLFAQVQAAEQGRACDLL